MEKKIETARLQGDTLGGIVEILIRGCPPGLGDPVFDKLEADLAKGLMSIGAIRGSGGGCRIWRGPNAWLAVQRSIGARRVL